MCLCKKSRIPRIAIKDIVVYKIVVPTKNTLNGYKTPYRNCIVYMNNLYHGKFDYQDTLFTSFIRSNIESGYIHSYISLESLYNYTHFPNMCIAKCIIPKGTLYWIGDKEDIASRKLKYLDIIVEGNREKIQNFMNNYGNK